MAKLGEDQHLLFTRFLDVDRESKKISQKVQSLKKIYDGMEKACEERSRKGKDFINNQKQIIDELNSKIEEQNNQNESLTKDFSSKQRQLESLVSSNNPFGMKPVDEQYKASVERYLQSSHDRRKFQNESEELPVDWDMSFKKFIQDHSSSLKTAMAENPSSKSFPGLLEDLNEVSKELYTSDLDLRADQRKYLSQLEKQKLLQSVKSDIEEMKQKLNDKEAKFNESLYADKIKEKREQIMHQRYEAQAIITDIKTQSMANSKDEKDDPDTGDIK